MFKLAAVAILAASVTGAAWAEKSRQEIETTETSRAQTLRQHSLTRRTVEKVSATASRAASPATLASLKAVFEQLAPYQSIVQLATFNIQNADFADGPAMKFVANDVHIDGAAACDLTLSKSKSEGWYASAYFEVMPVAANLNAAHIVSMWIEAPSAGTMTIEQIGAVKSATIQFPAGNSIADVLFWPTTATAQKVMIRTFMYNGDVEPFLCLGTAELHIVK